MTRSKKPYGPVGCGRVALQSDMTGAHSGGDMHESGTRLDGESRPLNDGDGFPQ